MKKALYILVALALILLPVLPVLAEPGTDQEVDTEAIITSSGSAPIVKAKWEGPDMDRVRPGVQIIPNIGPDTTKIWVYAVVTDPVGPDYVTDVFFDIYEPDVYCGEPVKFKVQVHMSKVPCAEAVKLVQAAADAGLITYNGYDLADLLWQLDCEKHQAYLWCGYFEYDVHQLAGTYKTIVRAVNAEGTVGELANTSIEIASIVALDIDFSAVNWGTVKPGYWKVLAGDDVFQMNDGKPTVWNRGNDPASLSVENTALEGAVYHKLIEQFDAGLLGQRIRYLADEEAYLKGPLMPCTPVQIEFSVHPEIGLPVDTYSGTLELEIYHADGHCMYCPEVPTS